MKVEQECLGYLIFDGIEVPIITERLRDVPLDNWLYHDESEEFEAQAEFDRQCARQCARRADETEWLRAVVAELAEQHPGTSRRKLIMLLPEADRTKAEAIMHARVPPLYVFPLERGNRQPWHRNVEEAIDTLIHTLIHRHKGFGIDDILAKAGIGRNSIEYPAAKAYAYSIFNVLTSYPATANVRVPELMQQIVI